MIHSIPEVQRQGERFVARLDDAERRTFSGWKVAME
jgi:hypothetical protein